MWLATNAHSIRKGETELTRSTQSASICCKKQEQCIAMPSAVGDVGEVVPTWNGALSFHLPQFVTVQSS